MCTPNGKLHGKIIYSSIKKVNNIMTVKMHTRGEHCKLNDIKITYNYASTNLGNCRTY